MLNSGAFEGKGYKRKNSKTLLFSLDSVNEAADGISTAWATASLPYNPPKPRYQRQTQKTNENHHR